MKKLISAAAIAMALIMAFAGCGKQQEESSPAQETSTEKLEFSSIDLDGNPIDSSVFSNADLTLVNVWSTSCGYCIQEMPSLAEISQEYADQNFQIVGIVLQTVDESYQPVPDAVAEAQSVVEETGATFPHIQISEDMLQTKIGEVMALPTSFFVDEEGNYIGEPYLGAREKAEWESLIQEVMEQV